MPALTDSPDAAPSSGTASPATARATASVPDAAGRFGDHGGRYVPETLMRALEELADGYAALADDDDFHAEFQALLREYVGRPTPLYRADRLSEHCARQGTGGGASVWLKREDLNHTGAHKINNSLGQALLARKMGKRRIIAETGAGQHGVATATACARFGLECVVYMGEEDIRRQALNVFRMKLMGAEVRPVSSGSKTLKDATNEAMRDWMGSVADTHYIIGSVVGPAPFPKMVRDFQSVIGRETKQQASEHFGGLPDEVVACVGGGSNAAGIFYPFVEDESVTLVGVEAGGRSQNAGDHASTLSFGRPGVLHGSFSYVLQDDDGQTSPVHSVSAGLDYPGVGPEHSYWKDTGRVKYVAVGDDAALSAFRKCSELEGIIPAVETAHAIQYVLETAGARPATDNVVICLSGRGDKDVYEVARLLGEEL